LLPTIRLPDLLGRLALLALEARHGGRAGGKAPVLVVVTNSLSARTISEIESFMASRLPDLEWGLLDGQGNVRFLAPSLGLDLAETGIRVRDKGPGRQSKELFSDLNRWMAKILLLRRLPARQWGGPTGMIGTPTDLARIAKVSAETAHRFVRTFEQHGFIRRSTKGLQLLHAEALLEAWLASERQVQVHRTALRWYLGKPKSLQEAFSPHSATTLVVGGFEATRRLGLLHTDSGLLEVHAVGDWRAEIPQWKVEPCQPDQADLFLLHPACPNSIVRASVAGNNLPTVDVLQAALDVVHSPARGPEQARFLMEHILASLPEVER
jgi:hypothetical protein